jgi:hypothetical protein
MVEKKAQWSVLALAAPKVVLYLLPLSLTNIGFLTRTPSLQKLPLWV